MEIKELLDEDEAFDPKKLFDEKEYSTLIINREGFNKKENNTADLLESLLEKQSRQESEEIFKKLKEANAQKMMVNAIKAASMNNEKTLLTAACWETGLDFSDYFLSFVELATNDDFQLALEALSVVESCEGTISETILTNALEIAQTAKSKNPTLVNDLIENIKSRIA
jgi:hypothetical protein